MSLGTCLADLQQRKLISDQRAEELRGVYDELVEQYVARGMDRSAAEAAASTKALDMADLDHLHAKRAAALTAQKQGEWLKSMQQGADEDGLFSLPQAEDFMTAMDNHRQAVAKQAHAMNHALLENHRRGVTGEVRNPDELGADGVLGELFGRDTGSLNAREIADSWRQTSEWLRSRFNAAGGRIAKLDLWRLPQRHDMRAIRDAGFEAWRDFTLPKLDRAAMIDHATGEPLSDAKLEILLSDTWTALATDGWSRNQPGGVHPGAVGNSRAGHRFLHFADPEGWAAYAEQFGGYGEGNTGAAVFDAMVSHIEGMARDIAALERMGPNPAASLKFMQQTMQKNANEALLKGRKGDKATDTGNSAEGVLQRLYDEFTGASNRPERRRLAMGFSIFRAVQTAAKLGGATLSVGGDFGTMFTTARFNGIPARKVMARYLSMLNPASAEDRAHAARTGLILDTWVTASGGAWRSLGEEIAHEGSRRLAHGVLRASGLMYHTDVAKQAFGMELVSNITAWRGKDFAALDPAAQRLLERYGIGAGRWDQLRAMQPDTYKGTEWLWPETVAKQDQALADDLMRMIVTEADHAVPVPDLRSRTMLNSMGKRGTWGGEIIRSAFLFKGFPVAVLAMHGRRMASQGMRGKAQMAGMFAARYGLTILTATTLGGALSIQLKEIAKGRDPRPMDDAKFWGAAALQGGGLGIFGDLLYASQNRFGGGSASTLAGPGAQALDNTVLAVAGGIAAEVDGDEETEAEWKKVAAKAVMSETPGVSLWYTRLALERTLGDLLTEWSYDEDSAARYRRLEGYAEDMGTQYYAPPGTNAEEWRAPDLENVLGEQVDN